MLKIEKLSVMNFENAIRGARNPLNSWDKSDSFYDENHNFVLGENDLGLAKRLVKAGTDHRKFIRQIIVSMDITAPLYWFKEFDTYKISTVANSTSTMHKIHSKPFEMSDFSCDNISESGKKLMENIIAELEKTRLEFVENHEKEKWYDLIAILPSSYNQLRTVTLNYENALNMYFARKNHKLFEWHTFCEKLLAMPYFSDFVAVLENK